MTRFQFDSHFAATLDNWHEPVTLNFVNDLAFRNLADVDVDDPNIAEIVKSAFDFANNAL